MLPLDSRSFLSCCAFIAPATSIVQMSVRRSKEESLENLIDDQGSEAIVLRLLLFVSLMANTCLQMAVRPGKLNGLFDDNAASVAIDWYSKFDTIVWKERITEHLSQDELLVDGASMYLVVMFGSASSSSYSRNGWQSTSTLACSPGISSDTAMVCMICSRRCVGGSI
jgi:hypothetical protein